MIGFAFDYVNAASLLALKPTCALADELGVDIEWLPLPTPARDAPLPARNDETVAQRHTRVRAEYFAHDTARYAGWQGIEVNRDADGVDSTVACAGGLWANRHGVARDYNRRVMREFWAGRLDIEDRDAITNVLADSGAPGFGDFDFVAELAAHRESVRGRGVFMLPTLLVGDEVFVGRQHLPMVRWLLTDREGSGPL